ncbi:helix-turn-helix domain-containing protein [Nocardia cyriacigeorgica]|uniref:helix-turn-helix domain-containing protein n=1 Tax=Nocardia cyriacigeorgica TaxID=135487 RepID=UPI001894F04E|nr:helix-turn-helix transcriptional regulator [Nocardia cyriacigeorgica]MBF6090639.1 helix-turn-helix domain-containing protein [Nocardia cyriacigeorgica]MBF6399730.1 helix-turn-helix domain-containing protein [Nocardia cyriacigeorgica]MBF6405360.1 helix-turn-helix domain-containing protein [Nocardia cyriacigeorgica]
MPTSGNTVPRRQLGKHLREMRQAAGLSIAEAARQIGRGAGTVQRLETGHPGKIHIPDIVGLCELYDEVEQQEALLGLAKEAEGESKNGGWWHEYGELIPASFAPYLGLESVASSLMVYRPDLVSGLFQTTGYARALDSAYFSGSDPEELDRRVRMRIGRQRIISRKRNPVAVKLILDEAVMRRVVGGRKVMATQLRCLADLPTNVQVRVLPFAQGFPLGTSTGPFTVLDFERTAHEPPTVFVESSYTGDMYYDRPASVDRYRKAFHAMWNVALNEVDTKCLLRARARECERER